MTRKDIYEEINYITQELIALGISVEENFPSMRRETSGEYIVDWGRTDNISIALRNIPYNIVYDELDKSDNYSLKLVDESLLQFMYLFEEDELVKHRLAYYPSPHIHRHQENVHLLRDRELYEEILYKNIVPFPIRFDYSSSDEVHIDTHHSKSHITLGHYKNCRIPVNTPVTPSLFIDFILRNFYSNFYRYSDFSFHSRINLLDEAITDNERKVLHFNIQS
ncbi:DUF2290 domain-containing protein [Bacillus altitudinis]|uniref:DUF2290 domain-containing protein n=1 Tax=Bacillus altitudinis TaxID=293387 RepID=UPI0009CC2859|nr:DUF2290 domain-containing protein [Bacillus altitudinis]OPW98852.1 hypothetical protein BG911_10215 [Bacillus altitudinis]